MVVGAAAAGDCYTCPADGPAFPKKLRNVPDLSFKSRCSSVSSEWASVKVVPEEEMTEHNLLAVRVMVTSDGSSSELEPDLNGDPTISELNERPLPQARSSAMSSRAPLLLNTSLIKREKESKAMHALQRAYSLRDTSTSRKYQHWKKKIQSTHVCLKKYLQRELKDYWKEVVNFKNTTVNLPDFPLLYSKKHGPSLRDASANLHSDAAVDDLLEKELTSPNEIPEITGRRFEAHRSTFHTKRKAADISGEIPAYIPHYSLHNDSNLLTHSKSFCHQDQTSAPRCPPQLGVKACSTEEGQYLGNQVVNREQLAPELFPKDPDTSSVNLDVGDRTASPPAREQQDRHLNKAKNKIMKKLTLSMGQQPKLLAINGAEPEETSLGEQGEEVIPGQKNAYFYSYENIPKQSSSDSSLTVSDKHWPILFPEHKHPKNVNNSSKESATTQPKSPLRLIANAIKKSILEPFMSSPENLKKSPDTHAKIHSENTFFKFPPSPTDSVSVKNSKNSADCDVQTQELHILRHSGKRHGIRSSDTSDFASNPKEECSWDAFPVYSVHNSLSKHPHKSKHASTDVEDVPTLLEKFTLKENLWRSAKDDWHAHHQKNTMQSSLQYRDKTASATSESCVQRNNVWNLFSSFRSKVDDKLNNPSSAPMVSPCTIFDVDEVLNNSSKGGHLGSEHLPVGKQGTDYCSSSSDDELEYSPLLSPTIKRSLRRRRKLEKETKQLVKQEERKRLHKAQIIQRLLEEVEEKQKAVEVYGVQLERELRGESDSSTQDDSQLLHEWFGLVLEKNKLMRYESELLIIAKELELEDHQN